MIESAKINSDEIQASSQDIHPTSQNEDNLITKMAQIRTPADVWIIFIGAFFLGLCIDLISTVTYSFLTRVTSEFGSFDVSAITDVIKVIVGIFVVPFFAALSDIYGRGLILALSLFIMIIGLLVIGFSHSFSMFSAGNVINTVGQMGRGLLVPVILADFLTPRNRGFGFVLFNLPGLLSLGLSLPIINPALEFGWRWMFRFEAIFIVITAFPLLFGLFRLQRRAQNLMSRFNFKAKSLHEVDWIGIVLLTAGLGFLLCPFTLVIRYENGWASPAMFVPLIIGIFILAVFGAWELKFTRCPLVSKNLLKSRAAVTMIVIRAFLSLDEMITWQYFSAYFMVSRGIDEERITILALGYRLAWYFMAVLCAILLKRTKYVRELVWLSIAVNVIGVGLTLPARHPHNSEAFIVLSEALIGSGAGMASCAGVVVLQSTVDFKDIAKVTALDTLISNIFLAISSAIATNVWNATLSKNLLMHLPAEYASKVPELIGSILTLPSLPSELTENWMQALGDTQWLMCTISTCLACLCLVVSLTLPKINLDACQVESMTKTDDQLTST